jgi:uncharacterized protein
VGGRRFDVAALVEDEAILCVPISPRHARCAPPTVREPADAEARTPFAALAKLRSGGSQRR